MTPNDLMLAAGGSVAGLIVALGIFLVADRFLTRARLGNRALREARGGPHVGRLRRTARGERRDIGQ